MAEIISHKPSAIPMAVKQWWSDFDKEPATAVGKLTNMMIEVPFLFILQGFSLQRFLDMCYSRSARFLVSYCVLP